MHTLKHIGTAALTSTLFFAATSAFAVVAITNPTPQRSYVSAASGNDANDCSQLRPCRTIQAALAQVNDGGEVLVLDSGGFGINTGTALINITQSVTITVPNGIYAGISPGINYDGIDINAPGSVVVIRGLSINSQSATAGTTGGIGINILAAAKVSIENCVINGMPNAGVSLNQSSQVLPDVVVESSQFHNNHFAINLEPVLTVSASRPAHATIHNVLIDADDLSGNNPNQNDLVGIYTSDATGVSIDSSRILGQTLGVIALNGGQSPTNITITNSVVNATSQFGVYLEAGGSLRADIRGSSIVNSRDGLGNGSGVYVFDITSAGTGGVVALSNDVITGNVFGVDDTGAFSDVQSYGNNVIRGNDQNTTGTVTPVTGD